MTERERTPDPENDSGAEPAGGEERLSQIRNLGNALLAAGDDAVARTISSDSEQFLGAIKQEGGQ